MVDKKPKVLHVITGLNNGGAEGVLFRLVTNDQSCQHVVISLMDEGKYGPLLKERGIRVICLGMKRGRPTFSGLYQLWRLMRKLKPNAVQTWMYHADLFGGIIARLSGVRNIFWGIRHSDLDVVHSKRSTHLIVKVLAFLSRWIPKKIICCAHSAKAVHEELGYDKSKLVVIENGYDLSIYEDIDSKLVAELRSEWLENEADAFIIGMVGRFDPQKDHRNLLAALRILKINNLNFKCVLVGPGIDYENAILVEWVNEFGLTNEVLLLGQRSDIPILMAAFDLHVLSSAYGEGFPNVVAEAMAAGTPCVVTDVGDAAVIVGSVGWVVAPKDSSALASKIRSGESQFRNQDKAWQFRKTASSERIRRAYDLEIMLGKYRAFWIEVTRAN